MDGPLNIKLINFLPGLEIEPRFFSCTAYSLVTVSTELSRLLVKITNGEKLVFDKRSRMLNRFKKKKRPRPFLCLITDDAINTYGAMEIQIQVFLHDGTSRRERSTSYPGY